MNFDDMRRRAPVDGGAIDPRLCRAGDPAINIRQMKLLESLQLRLVDIQNDEPRRARRRDTRRYISELEGNHYTKLTNSLGNPFSDFLFHDLVGYGGKPDWEVGSVLAKEKLKGGVAVDVGCGSDFSIGWTLTTLSSLGANACIGIDNNHDVEIENRFIGKKTPLFPEEAKRFVETMGLAFLLDDMLLFVSSLKDKSVNFIVNGIDSAIMNSADYTSRLAEQMGRALKEGGIILGKNSILPEYFDGGKYEWIFSSPSASTTDAFIGFRKE